jgi:hypothetical protein
MRDLIRWQVRITLLLTAVILVSCGGNTRSWKGNNKSAKDSLKVNAIDSMIVAVDEAKDFDRKFALADSLEKTGDISSVRANYMRGSALNSKKDKAGAEVYFKKALDVEELADEDVVFYSRSARTLAQSLSVKNDYETTLR